MPKNELERIKKNDPDLIDDIIKFRKANEDESLEITVVKDFISVEKCRMTDDCEYINLPNNLQIIFDFYKSTAKEKYDWMQDEKNWEHKHIILHFLIKNADKQ